MVTLASKERTLPTVSVFPRDEPHAVELGSIASALGSKIGTERHGGTLAASVIDFFDTYKLEADEELTHTIIRTMGEAIKADQLYDSEYEQATRAAVSALLAHLPCTSTNSYPLYQTIQLTGWLNGQIINVDRRRFMLTGATCPQCEINPQAYGDGGGGVQCVDQRDCGWWFCY
jgi:hypothetical protein